MATEKQDTVWCFPHRAQYRPNEPVILRFHGGAAPLQAADVRLFRLEQRICCTWRSNGTEILLDPLPVGSYGVAVATQDGVLETAFDVTRSPADSIRYGFLSDFSPADDDTADIEWLNRLHLNTVQFYDWMYRHDALLPPDNLYSDPIGRPCSLPVIRHKIAACHAHGMRPFAYGAVYAATEKTFEEHPDWAAYRCDGAPLLFADWLHYMNVESGCPWSDHLIGQYVRAVRELGFSGIHMDTYGFPKRIYSASGEQICLERVFPPLIDAAHRAVAAVDPNNGVIFNAVNDWPTEAVAGTKQDAIYIEVWPPHDTYRDLYLLIRKARLLSHKPVVLAAYLRAFQLAETEDALLRAECSFCLANAVIMASGGTQLVLGEAQGLLSDSYYVRYSRLRPAFAGRVVRYADFLVRYAPLLYGDDGADVTMTAAGGINEDVIVCADGCAVSSDGRADAVYLIVRESRERLVLHLINLTNNSDRWNEGKNVPRTVRDVRISLRLDAPLRGIWSASPDNATLGAQSLPYTCVQTAQGKTYQFLLPELQYYTVLFAQME